MRGAHLGTLLVLLAGIAGWQALASATAGSGLASPAQTVSALRGMLGEQDFWSDVAETAWAFGVSLVIVLICGLAFGLLFGTSRLTGEVAEPLLVTFYALRR